MGAFGDSLVAGVTGCHGGKDDLAARGLPPIRQSLASQRLGRLRDAAAGTAMTLIHADHDPEGDLGRGPRRRGRAPRPSQLATASSRGAPTTVYSKHGGARERPDETRRSRIRSTGTGTPTTAPTQSADQRAPRPARFEGARISAREIRNPQPGLDEFAQKCGRREDERSGPEAHGLEAGEPPVAQQRQDHDPQAGQDLAATIRRPASFDRWRGGESRRASLSR